MVCDLHPQWIAPNSVTFYLIVSFSEFTDTNIIIKRWMTILALSQICLRFHVNPCFGMTMSDMMAQTDRYPGYDNKSCVMKINIHLTWYLSDWIMHVMALHVITCMPQRSCGYDIVFKVEFQPLKSRVHQLVARRTGFIWPSNFSEKNIYFYFYCWT